MSTATAAARRRGWILISSSSPSFQRSQLLFQNHYMRTTMTKKAIFSSCCRSCSRTVSQYQNHHFKQQILSDTTSRTPATATTIRIPTTYNSNYYYYYKPSPKHQQQQYVRLHGYISNWNGVNDTVPPVSSSSSSLFESLSSSHDSISTSQTVASSVSSLLLHGSTTLQFHNVLIVIKQTAYEEYSQLKLRGQAPKALRWKRLEQRYRAHKSCVTDLLALLRHHHVNFSCVNRVELDRQHLVNVDLVIAVGGDGTVLSAAHFLDHGTIPLLGINSDPNITNEDRIVKQKIMDERRSHGALCFCTSQNMDRYLIDVLYGNGHVENRTRIRCKVKSTFSETRLVPALNDLLLANPSPAAVSRFRMGWLQPVSAAMDDVQIQQQQQQQSSVQSPQHGLETPYGTVTRFGGRTYDVLNSINVWSSGMWVSTATGSSAAMLAAGGKLMETSSDEIQYLIREHMIENETPNLPILSNDNNNSNAVTPNPVEEDASAINNRIVKSNEKLHVRWNSQRGRIFIDGSHLTHDLELGDEILIDNEAPTLKMFSIRPNE